jgi:D-galactarolactone cycloisomerase
MVYENPLREKLLIRAVGDPATMKDGRLPIPDGPGLGIAVDPDALASHRIEG